MSLSGYNCVKNVIIIHTKLDMARRCLVKCPIIINRYYDFSSLFPYIMNTKSLLSLSLGQDHSLLTINTSLTISGPSARYPLTYVVTDLLSLAGCDLISSGLVFRLQYITGPGGRAITVHSGP